MDEHQDHEVQVGINKCAGHWALLPRAHPKYHLEEPPDLPGILAFIFLLAV